MTTNRRLLASLLALTIGCAPPAATTRASNPCDAVVPDAEAAGAARGAVRAFVAERRVPGVAVAVVRGDRLLWSEGFGVADLSTGRPVCRDTEFRLGSVSKVLTAAALLRLRDDGVVALDADVRTLVPAVAHQRVPVTLLQLAGHLGGIRHYAGREFFNTRRYDSVAGALGIFAADSLVSPPGTRYLYSSYGYNLLGAALEAASGEPYAEVVRRRVLVPLRLRRTVPESAAPDGAMAVPYSVQGDSLVTHAAFDPSDRLPSGGWVASAEDVARLGAALVAPDFLSQESQTLLLESQRTADGEPTGYSVGLRVGHDARGRAIVHHGGTSVGARAFLLVYPRERLAVAVVANGPAEFAEREVAEVAGPFLSRSP